MSPRLAMTFNPVKFDAMEIAQLAKDAGMKYIIITAKHHDGFAEVTGTSQENKGWMEKFGEWNHVVQVTDWKCSDDKATWEVEVVSPGDYQVDLTYAGEGRLVWRVSVEGGEAIQNQQNASHNYQSFPIGWLRFSSPGCYRVSVNCIDGNTESGSLKSISFKPVSTEAKLSEQLLLGKEF